MIDWGKYWILDPVIVKQLQANLYIDWQGAHSINTGEVMQYPLQGAWDVWRFEIKSPSWLEITGSLHKFWNHGTNANDFTCIDVCTAITELCSFLHVKPDDMTVRNLEFGTNIRPDISATEILKEVICFKNQIPSIPIADSTGYFIEFVMDDYYFKLYDKGKQYHTVNTLRVEIKAKNSRFIKFANIATLADLLVPENQFLLGRKIDNLFKDVVFDDSSIVADQLKLPDRKVYQDLCNPREWAKNKRKKTTTIRARENRFRAIVGRYGTKNLHHTLSFLVNAKWNELLNNRPTVKQQQGDKNSDTNNKIYCRFSGYKLDKKNDKLLVKIQ